MSKLFQNFPPVTSKQWKQQIQYELKGAEYSEVLWQSPDGITVKPFYHRDEDHAKNAVDTPSQPFRIGQDIFVFDVEKSARRAKDCIKRGADSIRFIIENPEVDVAALLRDWPSAEVHLHLKFLSIDFVERAAKTASAQNLKLYVHADPIGHLAEDGNWFRTPEKDNFETLRKIAACGFAAVSVNAALYQNAGATPVQQLAYALAHANEYFNRLPKLDTPLLFQVAVGPDYFFEIAKLRALRLLFDTLAGEYDHTADCHIIAQPSRRNQTLYDYNVNMLRTTTECMAAVLGGANTVINLPYDALYHKSNEFGERIARNQLLILKHESYFDKVHNAASGSYYVETLTQQLAEKALVLFKEIEANGGFLVKLGDGTIQRKIAESAEKEQAAFDQGQEILVGTNKYPNLNDRMAHDLELYPFVKHKPRKTLVTPIIAKRLAETLEQNRLASEEK